MTTNIAAATGPLVSDEIVAACAPWSAVVKAGQQLQIIDVNGNQAVDTLFYAAHDHAIRYSAQATVLGQGNIFLTTGSVLRAADGTALMTIVADEVGNHDTIAGACSKESNTLRYGITPCTSTRAPRTFSLRPPSGAWASATSSRT